MKFCLKLLFPLTLASFIFCAATVAQSNRLTVESDSISYDADTGNSIFQGNVVIVRGSVELKADTVEHYKDQQQGDYIVANGAPVQFTYDGPDSNFSTKGLSNQTVYRFNSHEIQMIGDVVIQDERTTLRAEEAIFNTETGEMRAISGTAEEQGEGDGRLKSTIVIDDN